MSVKYFTKSVFARRRLTEEEAKFKAETDFVVRNALSYLLGHGFYSIVDGNEGELRKIQQTMDKYRSHYGETARQLCMEIGSITENELENTLFDIYNDIFSDGITENSIMLFFIVTGEVCTRCFKKKTPENVHMMYRCFYKQVKNLHDWIYDHDGWESILNSQPLEEQRSLHFNKMNRILRYKKKLDRSLAVNIICCSLMVTETVRQLVNFIRRIFA